MQGLPKEYKWGRGESNNHGDNDVIEHLPEQWGVYALLIACLAPILYLSRRHIGPLILWVGEIILYIGALHLLLHGIVRVARWFHMESAMYFEDRGDPNWIVPIVGFWRPEEYHPEWLFYVQLAALCIITFLVFRSRPIKPQKPPQPRAAFSQQRTLKSRGALKR